MSPAPATGVAVIGGTGTLGPGIVTALLERGAAVRVLTRDVERARGLLPAEAQLRQTDLLDHDDVIAATADVAAVLLLTPHALDMTDVQLRIIRALRRTDVPIVKISGTSTAVHPDGPYALRQHWEIEEILKGSGQPHVILRPNGFMQSLVGRILLPSVAATGTVPNAIGSAGISLIDARDIGEVAAEVLLDQDWRGQTLVLTGPRAVTYAELADLVTQKSGRPVKVAQILPSDVKAMMLSRGTHQWEAEHFEEMYELFRRGESEFVTHDVEKVTGHPARTIEAYLDETPVEVGGAG